MATRENWVNKTRRQRQQWTLASFIPLLSPLCAACERSRLLSNERPSMRMGKRVGAIVLSPSPACMPTVGWMRHRWAASSQRPSTCAHQRVGELPKPTSFYRLLDLELTSTSGGSVRSRGSTHVVRRFVTGSGDPTRRMPCNTHVMKTLIKVINK
jgi:hypothetical protein